jgi:hypothetical protein
MHSRARSYSRSSREDASDREQGARHASIVVDDGSPKSRAFAGGEYQELAAVRRAQRDNLGPPEVSREAVSLKRTWVITVERLSRLSILPPAA